MPVCCLNLWIGLDWNGLFHIDKIVKKRNNDDNNDNNNSDKQDEINKQRNTLNK